MTKLKNTKKGMAKKALSISLVAAMLATSNVPVWAAEFTDGTDAVVEAPVVETPVEEPTADVFSAEPVVEAPVEEEATNDTALKAVKGAYDFSRVEGKVNKNNITWKGERVDSKKAQIEEGAFIYDAQTGEKVKDNTLKATWRVDGKWVGKAFVLNSNASNSFSGLKPPTLTAAEVGKAIELYIFEAADTEEAEVAVLDFGTVQAVDVTKKYTDSWTVGTTTATSFAFNGKEIKAVPVDDSLNALINNGSVITTESIKATDFTWKYSGSKGVVDGESTVSVFGTPTKEAAEKYGIKGEITGSYEINKVELTIEHVKVAFADADAKHEYTYTGDTVSIPVEDLKITYKNGEEDTKYDLSKYVKTVKTTETNVGDSTFTVTFDAEKLSAENSVFKNSSNVENTTATTKVKIVALNLADCSVEMLKSYTPEEVKTLKTSGLKYGKDYVIRKDNKVLPDGVGSNLTASLADTSEDAYKTAATYANAVVVKPKNTGQKNVTGTAITGTLTVVNQNFANPMFKKAAGATVSAKDDVASYTASYKPKYTGKEITPTWGKEDSDLGLFFADQTDNKNNFDQNSITIDVENNVNASDEHLAKITVTAKDGSNFAGCKAVFYFKIQQADVKAEKDEYTNSILTNIKKEVGGVEENKSYTTAEEYKNAIGLKIEAKADKDPADTTKKSYIAVPLTEGTDYSVTSYKFTEDTNGTRWTSASTDKYVEIKADITNKNVLVDAITSLTYDNNVVVKLTAATKTESAKLVLYVPVVEKTIGSATVTLEKDSYTYTGKTIVPKVTVTDNGKTLELDKDYTVTTTNALNAGSDAKVVITGKGDYQGTVEKAFTITKANAADVVFEIKEDKKDSIVYNGTSQEPGTDKATIKLGDVDVSSQFELTYGENINAGKGTVTFKPVEKNTNFEGTGKGEFTILGAELEANELEVYDLKGKKISKTGQVELDGEQAWTGKEITFGKNAKLTAADPDGTGKMVLDKTKDYGVVYYNNTDASNQGAYVLAVALEGGNYRGTYALVKDSKGNVSVKTIKEVTDANKAVEGTYEILVNNVLKTSNEANYKTFTIKGRIFTAKDVTVSNAVYAGGIAVKPVVTVKDSVTGAVLTEGSDYVLEFDESKVDATTTPIELKVVGKGQYATVAGVTTTTAGKKLTFCIDKKDLKDAFVSVKKAEDGSLELTVMNGNVVEKTEKFDVKDNGDGTATVSVVDGGKNYTGTATAKINDPAEDTYVGQAMIKEVKVVGNKATVILDGEADEAVGYDYVISTVEDYKNGRLPNGINKNQLITETSYQYLQKGTYYAYCHAWKKVNGKKVFGEWSNIVEFNVYATTPSTPAITSVKVSKNTVTVTYTKCKDATGYDIVLGSAKKKVNGEMRPVKYGKLVKKVTNGDKVTATFTKVPKGTYYVGLHAYNRSRQDNKKVFSPWSATKTIKVK